MPGTTDYHYRPFGAFRLFLAFLVVLQHFVANAGPLGTLYDYVFPYEIGSLAVLVFFCLSGFVITEAATQTYSRRPIAYLANRFLRIVPHFVVALAAAVIIHAVFYAMGTLRISDRLYPDLPGPEVFELANVAANIFGFMPGINKFLTFDFVDIIWAVRIEMVFYFLVFFVLLIPNRSKLPKLVPFALMAIGAATILVARQFGFGFFFLFGVLLYDYRRYSISLWVCGLGMSLYFFKFQSPTDLHSAAVTIIQYFILASLIAVMSWLAFKKGARRAFDATCGELSYPLYIHHQNILILMISMTAGYSYPVLFIGLALSLVASYGLMRAIDPTVNRLRDLIRGEKLKQAGIAAPSHARSVSDAEPAFFR